MTSNPTLTRFFTTQALRLTPLTPIHIGCGIDFEPTNYVIDDGVLYHFDPAQVPLKPQDRKALIDAANDKRAALSCIQGFFHDRRDTYAAQARQVVAVAAGVAEQHRQRIRQIAQREANGRNVINLLEIERTMHHPHSGMPYLPGSSLKGAMRTAWLDQINQGRSRLADDRNANGLEKRLLEGSFHTDPFRLIDVADASGSGVVSKVYFSTNHKKRQVFKDEMELTGKGPATRRECLVGGQHAALTGELRVDALPGQSRGDKVPGQRIEPKALAAACNRYYVQRLDKLLALLEQRGFASPEWCAGVRRLLAALRPTFERGEAFLLRVGRHSGAESVTLDGVRDIRIMQGRGMPARFADEATTVWLAAERENITRGDLLPFGWLLVERADAPEIPALREWCDRQPKPDLTAVQARLTEARANAAAEAERAAQAQVQRRAAEATAVEAAARKAAEDQLLTPNLREVRALADALRARVEVLRGGRDKANTEWHTKARNLAKRALAEGWPQSERAELAEMLAQELPKAVQIDWKDERKKLQIALLNA
jgi:CRISPR-associated protein Csm5